MSSKAPIQTPALIAEAGGFGMFSAACVAALLKAGYMPHWFGSYKHVTKMRDAAKARIAAGQGTPADEYLARCQVGHLSQDATHRDAGGRGDVCANREFGYDDTEAPCFPQSGTADSEGTEHHHGSEIERRQARAAGRQDSEYDPQRREADEDARGQEMVDFRESPNTEGRRPTGMTVEEANQQIQAQADANQQLHDASQAGASPEDVKAGAAARADSRAAAEAGQTPDGPQITPNEGSSNEAADCINNYRKAAMKAMRAEKCKERSENATANMERGIEQMGGNVPNRGDYGSEEEYQQALRAEGERIRGENRTEADRLRAEQERVRERRAAAGTAMGRANGAVTRMDQPSAASQRADDRAARGYPRERDARREQRSGHRRDARNASRRRDRAAAREQELQRQIDRLDSGNKAFCEGAEGMDFNNLTPDQQQAAIDGPDPNAPGAGLPRDTGSSSSDRPSTRVPRTPPRRSGPSGSTGGSNSGM